MVAMVFGAWQAWIYVQPQPEQVFVKTFDCPEGKMADVVPADDTPVVQWWWYEPDRHLVCHAPSLNPRESAAAPGAGGGC